MGLSQRAAARLLDINDRTATSSYRRGQVLELTIIHGGHGCHASAVEAHGAAVPAAPTNVRSWG